MQIETLLFCVDSECCHRRFFYNHHWSLRWSWRDRRNYPSFGVPFQSPGCPFLLYIYPSIVSIHYYCMMRNGIHTLASLQAKFLSPMFHPNVSTDGQVCKVTASPKWWYIARHAATHYLSTTRMSWVATGVLQNKLLTQWVPLKIFLLHPLQVLHLWRCVYVHLFFSNITNKCAMRYRRWTAQSYRSGIFQNKRRGNNHEETKGLQESQRKQSSKRQ